MPVQYAAHVGGTRIEVVAGDLLQQDLPAILLSANNWLEAGTGWALKVEQRAGPGYLAECRALVAAAGLQGLASGSAVVTGGRGLANGDARRWVLQAVTILYLRDGRPAAQRRIPATPEVVYGAVRAALERAELFGISGVATYLMAQRDGYRTAPKEAMAGALCCALLDHAAVATAVRRLVLCESRADKLQLAADALERAHTRPRDPFPRWP